MEMRHSSKESMGELNSRAIRWLEKVLTVHLAASCTRLVHLENIPTRPAPDWSIVRIYPRVLPLRGGVRRLAGDGGLGESAPLPEAYLRCPASTTVLALQQVCITSTPAPGRSLAAPIGSRAFGADRCQEERIPSTL
eukprot:1181358-Prorocentrum_minimum.AAC.2